MIVRERGPELEGPAAKTKELKHRVRTWMAKKELLDANPQWMSSGHVALSGATWGEEEPADSVRKAQEGEKKFAHR
jgi:hypothetical protein